MENYESLIKIYYKEFSSHAQTYQERFDSVSTRKIDFCIKQFNRKKEFQIFMCYTEETALLIEKIYRQYESFLVTLKNMPSIVLEQFALWCVVGEIKSTNDIEGVISTRRDLSEVLKGLSNESRFASIVKKYHALLSEDVREFKTCADIRNFYDEFLHEDIAKSDNKYKLDGKLFRKDSVDVLSSSGKILHRGAYPEEKIIQGMKAALHVLNDTNMPFLVRLSTFQYIMGYVHPFYDGNGRTARFIASYFLSKHFHYIPALRLSLTIKHQIKKYYKMFEDTHSEINCGDVTPFVIGFLEIISDTFKNIDTILNRKLNQLSRYREKIKKLLPEDRLTQEIYEILLQSDSFFGQGVSVNELIKFTGKSINTIKSRLAVIPKEHLIIEYAGKKKFYRLNAAICRD